MADEADPLDYWPGGGPKPDDRAPAAKPSGVVPVEFDTLLTQTTDPGAAQAVRLALENAGIAVFETSDGKVMDAQLKLLVRAADAERAGPIAAAVFARREKFKEFPRQQIPDYDKPSSPLMRPIGKRWPR